MKNHIKHFFYLLDAQAKKKLPFLILAFLIASLLDVIGISLIGAFLGLLTNPDFFLQKIPAFFSQIPHKKLIITAGLLILTAFIMKTIVMLWIQYKVVDFCQSLSIRLKMRLMKAYQEAPYTYHLQKNSSHMLSCLQENITGYINNILMPTMTIVSSFLIIASLLLFLLCMQPFSTLFLIGMLVSLGLAYNLFAKKKLLQAGKTVATTTGSIIKSIQQGLQGLTESRVLGKEKYFLSHLQKISQQYANSFGIFMVMVLIPRYLIENVMAIFVVGLSLGGILLGFDTANIVAVVGMFAAASTRLLPTVSQTMTALNQVQGSVYHMNLIYQDLKELSANRTVSLTDTTILPFKTISLEKIHFQYPQATSPTLQEISLTITKGQSIGLVGSSGAGKSTLINLMLGFLEPQQGNLTIDGKSVPNTRAWLNNFAYIPQTIFLLDDTLRRNIAFGSEDHEIDDARVWTALKMAKLDDVVQQLPEKLDTMLGENGVRLSGGQRQRVALARAFYYEREIIVMDEATSALDSETEMEVINTIKRLKGNKTLIVIAHRLTTVEHCDKLYRLQAGRIVASGNYDEVINEYSSKKQEMHEV